MFREFICNSYFFTDHDLYFHECWDEVLCKTPTTEDLNQEFEDVYQEIWINDDCTSNENKSCEDDENTNLNVTDESDESIPILATDMLAMKKVQHKNKTKPSQHMTPLAKIFRNKLYNILNEGKRISKKIIQAIHNEISCELKLKRMSRDEFRCISSYYNNYAHKQQEILDLIQKKKDELLSKIESEDKKA